MTDENPSLLLDQSDLPTSASFATLIATDGRTVKLDPLPGGALQLVISGRQPLVLDRFQSAALVAAVKALPDG